MRLILQRAAYGEIAADTDIAEWPCEGNCKIRFQTRVAVDGNSARYQGSVHDSAWNEKAVMANQGGTVGVIDTPAPNAQGGRSFFIAKTYSCVS